MANHICGNMPYIRIKLYETEYGYKIEAQWGGFKEEGYALKEFQAPTVEEAVNQMVDYYMDENWKEQYFNIVVSDIMHELAS